MCPLFPPPHVPPPPPPPCRNTSSRFCGLLPKNLVALAKTKIISLKVAKSSLCVPRGKKNTCVHACNTPGVRKPHPGERHYFAIFSPFQPNPLNGRRASKRPHTQMGLSQRRTPEWGGPFWFRSKSSNKGTEPQKSKQRHN